MGAAIGLDRLLTALEALGRTGEKAGYTDVLVLAMEEGWGAEYQGLAAELRRAGLATEVYPEKKKLAQQFAYAEKKKIPFALIRGGDEAAKGSVVLRELSARENRDFPSVSAAAAYAREKLGR